MDVLLATLACILEREPIVRAWRILPMRLIYRPMLSYCIWKAILRAIKGAWVSWGDSSAPPVCPCEPEWNDEGRRTDAFFFPPVLPGATPKLAKLCSVEL